MARTRSERQRERRLIAEIVADFQTREAEQHARPLLERAWDALDNITGDNVEAVAVLREALDALETAEAELRLARATLERACDIATSIRTDDRAAVSSMTSMIQFALSQIRREVEEGAGEDVRFVAPAARPAIPVTITRRVGRDEG